MTQGTNTNTEDAIYEFIVRFIKRNGYSPSVREIAKGTDVSSTNTVNYHKMNLYEAGAIHFVPGVARSITIVKDAKPKT